MRPRDCLIFLSLEIFAIVWAAALFSILESKVLAGGLAGGYFVLSGLYMLSIAARWPTKWTSPTFYILLLHVFVISLPMLIQRFLNQQTPFQEIRIYGIPGPTFHNISTAVFVALIAATVIDGVRRRSAAK